MSFMDRPADIDFGNGVRLWWTSFRPDRSIEANRIRYASVPDVDRIGALIEHPHGHKRDGIDRELLTESCVSGITFHSAADSALDPRPLWTVDLWDPFTLSPSILCGCGWHVFIKGGKVIVC